MELNIKALEEEMSNFIKIKGSLINWFQTGIDIMNELTNVSKVDKVMRELHLLNNSLQRKQKENENLRKKIDELQLENEQYKYDVRKLEDKLKNTQNKNENKINPLNIGAVTPERLTKKTSKFKDLNATPSLLYNKQQSLKNIAEENCSTENRKQNETEAKCKKSPSASNENQDTHNKKLKLSESISTTNSKWMKANGSKKPNSLLETSGIIVHPRSPKASTPRVERRLSLTKPKMKQTQLKFPSELTDTDKTFCEELENAQGSPEMHKEILGQLSFSVSKLEMGEESLNESNAMNHGMLDFPLKVKAEKDSIYQSDNSSDLFIFPTQKESVIEVPDSCDFQLDLNQDKSQSNLFTEDVNEAAQLKVLSVNKDVSRGNFCKACKNYYEAMYPNGINEKGVQILPCRHEGGQISGPETPINFWNPCFTPTQE